MKLEERCMQLDAILSASEKARLVVGVRSIVQSVVTDRAKLFRSSFEI
jgi:hypothetical protein